MNLEQFIRPPARKQDNLHIVRAHNKNVNAHTDTHGIVLNHRAFRRHLESPGTSSSFIIKTEEIANTGERSLNISRIASAGTEK